jgi:hypothetical protein
MKKTLVLSALTSGCVLCAAVALLLLGSRHVSLSASAESTVASSFPAISHPSIVRSDASYRQLPLSFERNQGQTDPEVKFLSRGNGYTVYLTPTEALLSLRRPSGQRAANGRMAVLKERKFDKLG